MSFRLTMAIGAFIGTVSLSPQVLAAGLRVTTQDCLDKGLCAYVSPTGRVTCGKCPGQVVAWPWTLTAPASAAALCADDVWTMTRTRNACSRHGGVKVFLKQ
jgi:hypothetical protein